MIRTEKSREDLQLNMAPMIDMIFLLIIFFLTATTFSEREREQDVLLPENHNPGSLSRSLENNLIVNVLKNGRLRVLDRPMELPELHGVIRERRQRARRPLKIQVRADKRTPYGNVARTLEVIEKAGVKKPYIVTKLVTLEG